MALTLDGYSVHTAHVVKENVLLKNNFRFATDVELN